MKRLEMLAVALYAATLGAEPVGCDVRKWDASPVSWRFDSSTSSVRATGVSRFAWVDAPVSRSVTFSAIIKPERRTGGDWSVLGLAAGTDEENFWHIALVVAPTDRGSRHSFELAEMREGRWLSNHSDNLRAKRHIVSGAWEFGDEYHVSLTLGAGGVSGVVKDSAGKTLFDAAYSFGEKPAVRCGRPAIHASGGFCGVVGSPDAEQSDPVAAPAQGAQTFPPYESGSFAPGVKCPATGFFRMAEVDGRSWVIDPLGRGTVLLGIDHVSYNGHWSQRTNRSLYREWNDSHYPSREAWAEETVARLKSWGFNMLGAGGHEFLEHRGLAHTRFLSMGDSLCLNEYDDEFWICPNEHRPCSAFPNVFHPLFPDHCEYVARKKCAPSRDDPWLFGYFVDNELAWWGRGQGATGLFDAVMEKPASHTAKKALLAFVAEEAARRGLGDRPWEKIPRADQDDIKRGFLRLAAERYFSITSSAIRRHDPNHLVLGARFAGLDGADAVVWEAAGRYCDVVTFNCYPWADLDRNVVMLHGGSGSARAADAFAARHSAVGRPMLITEWSFPALDSGLPCTGGAGQRFFTQAERTAATELFAKTMLALPFLVGYDYFMWVDEPAAGISDAFPEDSNYGLVNEQGVPYPEITSMFARMHGEIGRWRSAPLPPERPAARRTGTAADEIRARAYGKSEGVEFVRSGPSTWRLSNAAGLALSRDEGKGGKGLSVTLGGREIGDYCVMLHEVLPGGERSWRDADGVTSAEWKDGELLVTFESRGWRPFAVRQRISLSADGGSFLAELVELRNLGRDPIGVKSVLFRAYAPYAGASKPVKPVPNLWKGPRADAWLAEDGRWFGLRSTAAAATACHFYWNEARKSQHPDATCEPDVPVELAPGEAYRPGSGTMWYEAFCGLGGADELSRWSEGVYRGAPKSAHAR